jgi:hypothetical protein
VRQNQKKMHTSPRRAPAAGAARGDLMQFRIFAFFNLKIMFLYLKALI